MKYVGIALFTSLLMIAPSALAVHGSPYTATGTAIGPDGGVLAAEVSWTGWASRSYVVTLTDATGAVVVDHHTFTGSETWNGPVYYGTEFFWYNGIDTTTNGQFFHLQGIQIIHISTGTLWMYYVGDYGDYTLQLIVPY